MTVPFVAAWMEQPHKPAPWVQDASEVHPFVTIARHAGQRKVLKSRFAIVLQRYDVLDFKNRLTGNGREAAILTPVRCPCPDAVGETGRNPAHLPPALTPPFATPNSIRARNRSMAAQASIRPSSSTLSASVAISSITLS